MSKLSEIMSKTINVSKYALLLTPALLSGCLIEFGSTRFDSIPEVVAENLTFLDKNLGPEVGGPITITRPLDPDHGGTWEWTYDRWVLRWAINGVPAGTNNVLPNGESNYIGNVVLNDNNAYELTYDLFATPPPGVNGIIVFAANPRGEAINGTSVTFENFVFHPDAPTTIPENVQFTDQQNNIAIRGNLRFYISVPPEKPVTRYVARFGDANGCPLPRVAAIGSIAANGTGPHSFSTTKDLLPPKNAGTIVVVAANDHGEGYSTNCDGSSTRLAATTHFNSISSPYDNPYFQAKRVLLSADTDSTKAYSATLTIQPAEDERDVSGYYVRFKFDSNPTDANPAITVYSKNFYGDNGKNAEGHYTQAISGSLFKLGNIALTTDQYEHVTMEVTNVDPSQYTPRQKFSLPLKNKNLIGNWYMIVSGASPVEANGAILYSNNRCIRADDRAPNSEYSTLRLTTCDPYDVGQRFTTTNVSVPNFRGNIPNNDFYIIKSEKTGGCFYREPTAAVEAWKLSYSCDSYTWEKLMEIKAGSYGQKAKKIAEYDGRLNWSCATNYAGSDSITGTWLNCGLGTEIYWNFLKAGDPQDPGYFNHTPTTSCTMNPNDFSLSCVYQ